MYLTSDDIFEAVKQLPDSERLLLIERLLDLSEHDDELDFSDPEFKAELDRRSLDRTGEVAWDDLRTEHER